MANCRNLKIALKEANEHSKDRIGPFRSKKKKQRKTRRNLAMKSSQRPLKESCARCVVARITMCGIPRFAVARG